jgi:hypothetical protein
MGFTHIDLAVNVTEADIREGRPQDYGACPVALAMTKAIFAVPGVREFAVVVYEATTEIEIEGQEPQRFEHSDSVFDFIQRFDKGSPVAPFSFKLRGVKV